MNAFAERQNFILNCSGQSKTIRFGGTDIDNFYEDFEVSVIDKQIKMIETISTNHNLIRDGIYSIYDKNLYSDKKLIEIKTGPKEQDGTRIKEFKGSISISSGRYNGFWDGGSPNFNFVISWDAMCNGTKELYTYLNTIDKKIQTNKIDKTVEFDKNKNNVQNKTNNNSFKSILGKYLGK